MLPLIAEALTLATTPDKRGFSNAWQAGRPGKAAAWLCAADPGGFEPEQGSDLHSDIEFFYSIECVNGKGGSMAENPKWKVTVSVPDAKDFWDAPKRESLRVIASGDIRTLARRAKRVEATAWPSEK